jgi:hypothetical protein
MHTNAREFAAAFDSGVDDNFFWTAMRMWNWVRGRGWRRRCLRRAARDGKRRLAVGVNMELSL